MTDQATKEQPTETTRINVRGYKQGRGSLNTILPYHGEFMVNPVPLELSFNFCSHKCFYCFANLSSPHRKWSEVPTKNLLAQYGERSTLPATLLQQKMPVCVSNKVDPFAQSNYREAVPIMEQMVEGGIPLMVQTRGGRGIDDVLGFLPPSVWYISIATHEYQRRVVEPAAPPIGARLELVQQVIEKGHTVLIGLNPLVKSWFHQGDNPVDEVGDLIGHLKKAGATGVWVENLHLNNDQIRNMTDKERAAIGEDVLALGRKRKCPTDQAEFFEVTRQMVVDAGMEVFSVGQPNRSDFFVPFRELYKDTYPVMQDFTNLCHDAAYVPGMTITFSMFWDHIKGQLPEGTLAIGQYIGSIARNAWKDHQLTNQMTYEYMMGIIWKDPRIRACPARMPNFSYMCHREDGNVIQHYGDDGHPVVTFNPAGTLKYWFDVETEEYF